MKETLKKPAGGQAQVLPTLGLLPVLAISAAVAGEAGAQTAQTQTEVLDTITVQSTASGNTAATSYTVDKSANQKSTAPLIDTPRSVTVVTERQIAERGQTSLADVLRSTPGITLQAGEGGTPAGDIPYIRGFNASNDIMVDGIRNASRTSYEVFNLESVEINKGSDAATTAGVGGAGGSINLVTKAPKDGNFDDASFSLGTGNYKRTTLDSNRDFGQIGARLNLMYQDADDLGGRKGVTSKRYGIAPSVKYKIDDATSLTVGAYYYRNKDMPDYGIPMSGANTPAAYKRGSGTNSDPYKPVDVDTDTFYGLKDRDYSDNSSKSIYVRADHEFSDTLRWSTTLSTGKDKTEYYVTQPASAATGVTRGNKSTKRDNETVSFNSQLSGTADLFNRVNTFAIGVDVSNSKATVGKLSATGSAPAASYNNPNPNDPWTGSFSNSDAYGPTSSVNRTQSRSIYLFNTVEIDPQWEANFGLSYNRYKTDVHTYESSGRGGAITPAGRTSVSDSLVNGSLGLVYKITPEGRFYANISSSSSPAGTGAGTSDATSASGLDEIKQLSPEKTK